MFEPSTFDSPPSVPPPVVPQATGSGWILLGLYTLFFVAIGVGFTLGGTAGSFAEMGITFVPFALLATLAYLGRTSVPGKILTLGWLAMLALGMVLVSFSMVSLAVMPMGDLTNLGAPNAAPQIDPAALGTVALTGLYSVLALLFSLLGFIPWVRQQLSRVLPLDPDSFVHTIALVSVTALSLISFVPLLVLGEPAILSENAMSVLGESMGEGTDALLTQTYTLIWIIPAAIIAVGYGLRRDFRATLVPPGAGLADLGTDCHGDRGGLAPGGGGQPGRARDGLAVGSHGLAPDRRGGLWGVDGLCLQPPGRRGDRGHRGAGRGVGGAGDLAAPTGHLPVQSLLHQSARPAIQLGRPAGGLRAGHDLRAVAQAHQCHHQRHRPRGVQLHFGDDGDLRDQSVLGDWGFGDWGLGRPATVSIRRQHVSGQRRFWRRLLNRR